MSFLTCVLHRKIPFCISIGETWSQTQRVIWTKQRWSGLINEPATFTHGESIAAPSIVSPLVSIVVNETDVASLQCQVRGNPIPQITWMKENFSLSVTKRIQQSRGTLMITTVTSEDGGMYTCQAKNILGVVRSSATLTVQGKNNEVLFQCLCHERILSTNR